MPKSARNTPRITLRELTTARHWQQAYPLLCQQNKDLSHADYLAMLADMRQAGYRCVGAFAGVQLVGVMGFWVGTRFWCRKYIDLDNVVVDEKQRSRGIGKKLLDWVEAEGRRQGCRMAVLDSYTTAHRAHRFYYREGYVALGYHFTKQL
ncbi:MAG: GNAT family N-acetyltransferase [Proteobacteria bacterium]|nr:GNAT family N-acetyltransferase [Pseudomonadota bacterium]